MINGKIIGIDARMIEASGIGVYIQHQMGLGIYDVAVGREVEIRKYDKDVRIIPFDAPIYSPKEQLTFPQKAIREAGVALMHFPHYNVPLPYRGKFVLTLHDLIYLVLPEMIGSPIKLAYAKTLMANALKRSEHVFTVSENSKKDLQHFFGTPPSKITITYNGVDGDFREKEKAEVRYLLSKFGIPEDKKVLLYVGNLKPHKNLQRLLEAFKALNRDDTILLLVGKAFRNLTLEQREAELGIKNRVIHTGLVSKEELIDLYNLADVFVFPSLYEGFGIPPLEAMACGTPVIAANNSSIPEAVGDAAILVDAADTAQITEAIRNLLDDQALAEEYIRRGKAQYRKFPWDNVTTTIRQTLEGLPV